MKFFADETGGVTHIECHRQIGDVRHTLIIYPDGRVNYTGPNDAHPAFHYHNSTYTTLDVLQILYASDEMASLTSEVDYAEPLRGKDVMCWCPEFDDEGNPAMCHADTWIELANR